MYCVYCNENHEEGTSFNNEHIVPKALGGLENFIVRVCSTSNSTLGNDVDGPFIRMFPVNSDRFFLDLQSHRGKPMLDLSGTSVIDGKERVLRYEIQGGTRVFKIASPNVEVTKTGDEGRFEVSGDPTDVRTILLGKLSAAEKQGKTLRDELGNRVTEESIEGMIAEKSVINDSPSVLMTLEIDSYDAVRFFCKVALAAGFHQFGEPFGRSQVGEKLRLTMLSDNKVTPPGIFWPLVSNDLETYRFFKVPDAHVLAFLPFELKPLVITLFGGAYTAVIPLDDNPLQPTETGRVFQIDLKTKQLKRSSHEEYLTERPWIQKTAG